MAIEVEWCCVPVQSVSNIMFLVTYVQYQDYGLYSHCYMLMAPASSGETVNNMGLRNICGALEYE